MATSLAPSLDSQLWDACLDGNVSLVESLIRKGADVHCQGQGGKTPLGIAAYCNKVEVVKLLLKHGVDVNEVDQHNRSALHWAAQFGHTDTAKVLLNHGASADILTKESRSPPLLVAAATGQLSVLKLLVSKGASWNITNKNGISPTDIASTEGHQHIIDYLSQLDDSQKRLTDAFTNDLKVQLKVTRMSIHGPPGSGKTCLQKLLLNEDPPESRASTGMLTPAVRACAETLLHSGVSSDIRRIDEDEFLVKLAQKLNNSNVSSPTPSTTTCEGATPCRESRFFQKFIKKLRPKKQSSFLPTPASPSSPSSPSSLHPSRSHFVNYEIVSRLPSDGSSEREEEYKAHWIYCIDSGGQPAYQDIAPSFLHLNSINIITLRLIDQLDHYPKCEFVLNNHYFSCPDRRQFTNRQIITSFARSLLSVSPSPIPQSSVSPVSHQSPFSLEVPVSLEPQSFISNTQPQLLVVGTFSDEKEKCPETLQQKNVSLNKDLHPYKEMCIQTTEGNYIHPINTLVKENRSQVSASLSQIITKRSGQEVDVPFKWFCFNIEVSKEAKNQPFGVISRERCLSIASDFEMLSSIEDMLCFFHRLGTILYFPSVLPNVIFTDPEPLLENISQLVYLTFLDKLLDIPDLHFSLPPYSHERLKTNGVFTLELIKNTCQDFVPNLFTPLDFVKLLIHLLIIGEISPERYFIPCVLPWLELTEVDMRQYCNEVEPIILSWPEDTPTPIPYGLFTGLANSLIGNKNLVALLDKSNDFHQARNRIGFLCKRSRGWLLLVDKVCYIEVYYTGTKDYCVDVLRIVCEGLESTARVCQYRSEPLMKGFYDKVCGHIHYTVKDGSGRVTFACGHKVKPLTSHKYMPWFVQENPVTASVDDTHMIIDAFQLQTVDNTPFNYYNGPDFRNVLDAVNGVTDWRDLGHRLHLNPPDIDSIKETNRGDVKKCRYDMIQKWMMTGEYPSWRTLCQALLIDHPFLAKQIGKQHPHRTSLSPSHSPSTPLTAALNPPTAVVTPPTAVPSIPTLPLTPPTTVCSSVPSTPSSITFPPSSVPVPPTPVSLPLTPPTTTTLPPSPVLFPSSLSSVSHSSSQVLPTTSYSKPVPISSQDESVITHTSDVYQYPQEQEGHNNEDYVVIY